MTPHRPTEARGRRPHRPQLLRAIGLDLPLVRRAMRWIVLSACFLVLTYVGGTLGWISHWWSFERLLAHESTSNLTVDPWFVWVCPKFEPDGIHGRSAFLEIGGEQLPGRWRGVGMTRFEIVGVGLPGSDGRPGSGEWHGNQMNGYYEVDRTSWWLGVRTGRARDFATLGRDPAFLGAWECLAADELRADGLGYDGHGNPVLRWAGSGDILIVQRSGWGYEQARVRRYVRLAEEPFEDAGPGWFETGGCVRQLIRHLGTTR